MSSSMCGVIVLPPFRIPRSLYPRSFGPVSKRPRVGRSRATNDRCTTSHRALGVSGGASRGMALRESTLYANELWRVARPMSETWEPHVRDDVQHVLWIGCQCPCSRCGYGQKTAQIDHSHAEPLHTAPGSDPIRPLPALAPRRQARRWPGQTPTRQFRCRVTLTDVRSLGPSAAHD